MVKSVFVHQRYIVQYTITSCCITGLFDNVILYRYTTTSCCITGLSYIITIGTVLYYHCTVLVARPTEKKVRQTLLLPSAVNWSLRRPPRLDRPEAVAWCRLLSKCSCRCLCVQWTSSRVRLGQSFKTIEYGCTSCWGDVEAGGVEAGVFYIPFIVSVQYIGY